MDCSSNMFFLSQQWHLQSIVGWQMGGQKLKKNQKIKWWENGHVFSENTFLAQQPLPGALQMTC